MSHRRKMPRSAASSPAVGPPSQPADASPPEANGTSVSPRAPNRIVLAISVAFYAACVAFLLWQALRG